ncbi:MAG: 1-acyl-sn-glycerol-3-phosphate acyltransferase [Euryarchaeota archaeon]|nr:1-acyl-sn-glycerol-3-phosphate acyltransferase [Euryarchaeota archaeon]MBT3654323.1 1-acyl-sn-glycerol-3-phosphate acyltransferase [Euryarchaeota archaeon]MBT3757451.1 1-acyl-sn-glycerol-3-phosphate acyltransferase [Euryarchaeota archaeon]MBT4050543.1 1-acyl-sn-glycerol-3-phosphate acyltransferase [Euryarchaeota archaeon]MBT4961637.1 1-acyl-sn-glycerol-3-phosphate acyltransferase [Euryarchaeota archaeon]
MSGLSEASLNSISSNVQLHGTDNNFRTPFMYRFLLFILPPIIRPFTNIKYIGLENIPTDGAAIFVGNHTSHIDPFVKIMASMRPMHYLAKEEYFEKHNTRILMESTGQIETLRKQGGTEALSRAVDVLSADIPMAIFPEGTRSRRKQAPFLARGKTGAARLAAKFPNIPIVPIAIIGARDFMSPGNIIIHPWKKVTVNIGQPITFGDWISHSEGGSFEDKDVQNIMKLDEHGQRSIMKSLFRDFTDQIIESLRLLGAP